MTEVVSERAVRHRAEILSTLASLDSFDVLRREVALKQARIERALTARVLAEGMSGEAIQRQADQDRGFILGMLYITEVVPRGAARVLASHDTDIEETDEEVVDLWSYA